MSASPAHGDRPPLQGLRRSFTTPTRQLSVHEKAGLDKTDANADVLYMHPSARIISFSPPTDSIRSSSKAEIPPDTDYPIDTVETLPWRSRTETLAASGILVIEKVRGSTNFLKCQDIMHAILRNSQCWCVDGESKFVLRVRQFKYYRIELPSTTDENKAKVEELKKVLPTVLRFERTPCPFIRAFTVDLPDDAITPRRKGQWKRRDSSQPNLSDSETPPVSRGKATRSWSMKSPPTSYPKNGPGSAATFERGRPVSSAGASRRDFSFDNYRNSSPASYVPSEDGSDSEHQESEHDSEKETSTDHPETALSRTEHVSKPTFDQADDAQSSKLPADKQALLKTQTSSVDSNTEESDNEVEGMDSVQVPPKAIAAIDRADRNSAVHRNETTDDKEHVLSTKGNESALVVPQIASDSDSNTGASKDTEPSPQDGEDPPTTDIDGEHSTSPEESSEDLSTESDNESPHSEQSQLPGAKASIEADIRMDIIEEPFQDHMTSAEKPNVGTDSDGINGATEIPIMPARLENANSTSMQLNEPDKANYDTLYRSDQDDSASESDLESEEAIHQPTSTVDSISTHMPEESVSKSELPGGTLVNQDEGQQTPLAASTSDISLLSEGTSDTEDAEEGQEDNDDTLSAVSSVDSFHTMASNVRGSPVSPRSDNRFLESQFSNLDKGTGHRRGPSEMTIIASSTDESSSPNHDVSSTNEQDYLQAPPLPNPSGSNRSEPTLIPSSVEPSDGLRQRLKSRRSFSPLPPPSTIFTGNQIRHDSGSGHMTKAILQKVIVKPIEVVVLVVHILARIAGGATMNDLLSGELFRRPEHRRSVSGFADQLIDGRPNDSDTDDDFGVPIRGRRRSSERRLAMVLDEVEEDAVEDVD